MNQTQDTRDTRPSAPHLVPDMSQREQAVLLGISHGLTNAGIAQRLDIAENTVKSHTRRLFRKLGATDRAHAVRIGFELGLLWDHQPPEFEPVVRWVAPYVWPSTVAGSGDVGVLLQRVEAAVEHGREYGMTLEERLRWSPVWMCANQLARKLNGGDR